MEKKYQKRVERYTQLSNSLNKPISRLGYIKLSIIIITIIHSAVAFDTGKYWQVLVVFIAMLTAYIYFETKHKKIIAFKEDVEILVKINQDGVKRFNREWRKFIDKGTEFVESDHPYGFDLDIIGRDSLFQWTNMCMTPWGRNKLSETLLAPENNISDIVNRQEAISELAGKVNFRHRLKLEAGKIGAGEREFSNLVKWAKGEHSLYQKKWFSITVKALPVVTLAAAISGLLLNVIPSGVFIYLLLIQVVLLVIGRKERGQYLESVHKAKRSLEKLNSVFLRMEKHKFHSNLLLKTQSKLLINQKELPSKQIKALSRIASSISNRRSSVYLLLNVFLLWDYQCCLSLEKWKITSGKHLEDWFDVVGEFECLSSIALIKHDHPDWTMPTFEPHESNVNIKADQVAHPLMGADCVANSIEFTKDSPIALITGSNMSGKSTFLRTVGINLVLAYSGAPVYAKAFSCQSMKLYTCMRVSDDLQKNISSFYGELLRIKMISEEVKRNNKVFFLLDEIFKGTNSADRHLAAKAVIHNMDKSGATGMVSTHDLELDVIEEESKGRVTNHHFEETYKDDQILFDYQLKEGVSKTRNAIFLIKAAGIEI